MSFGSLDPAARNSEYWRNKSARVHFAGRKSLNSAILRPFQRAIPALGVSLRRTLAVVCHILVKYGGSPQRCAGARDTIRLYRTNGEQPIELLHT